MELFCLAGAPSGTPLCNLWFQLALAACVLAPVVIIGWIYGRFRLAQHKDNEVRRTGIRTTGVLESVEILIGAANGAGGRIPVRLYLLVQSSTAPDYKAECLMHVHPLRLQMLRIGQSMPVYCDPQNPQRIVVDDLG